MEQPGLRMGQAGAQPWNLRVIMMGVKPYRDTFETLGDFLSSVVTAGRDLGNDVRLEYAAEATGAGTYAQAMTDRANGAMERLRAIQSADPQPAIEQVLAAAGQVDLAPNANAELVGAAERIRTVAMAFAAEHTSGND